MTKNEDAMTKVYIDTIYANLFLLSLSRQCGFATNEIIVEIQNDLSTLWKGRNCND